jgi:prepilin-type processing-associated H-X9-DG protein
MNRTPPDRRPNPTAFTLVELLVVIGIIALLISILLPTMSRARQAALATQCLSNERQIGMYLGMYANQYHGFLPPNQASSIRLLPQAAHDAIDHIMKNDANINPNGDPALNTNAVSPNNPGTVFYCPTLQPVSRYMFLVGTFDQSMFDATPAEHWRKPAGKYAGAGVLGSTNAFVLGYFYLGNPTAGNDPNMYWLDTDKNGTPRNEYVVKFSERGASNVAILTDVVNQVVGLKKENWYVRHPADKVKKGGGSNVLYGDGHAAYVGRDDMQIRWYLPNAVGW